MHTLPQGTFGKQHLQKWLLRELSDDDMRKLARRLALTPRFPGY